VIMRAMSVGLIKGMIDEVDGIFSVTWVQPRVLSVDQLGVLKTQIGDWNDRYANDAFQLSPCATECSYPSVC
jgi:26S proteasome regulatory subunit N9